MLGLFLFAFSVFGFVAPLMAPDTTHPSSPEIFVVVVVEGELFHWELFVDDSSLHHRKIAYC